MKTNRLLLALPLLGLAALAALWPRPTIHAQSTPVFSRSEYLTVRWAGRDNTHVIRPGGLVEFIGPELRKLPRPDRCDDRSFYMNTAMNGLVKEGWEFAGMTPDDIIMRRPVGR
ncbi:hypothetical protein LBMAG56_41420 [Verrucomicrobiota bacterium]|nr:hypothetical protein LBMAG56_41420 [Verrucomicrobiota bacterium]